MPSACGVIKRCQIFWNWSSGRLGATVGVLGWSSTEQQVMVTTEHCSSPLLCLSDYARGFFPFLVPTSNLD